MVNDPYLYGQIAATNALSDVYAMGGEVITALNILTFPEDMDLDILHDILKGGAEKVLEAGGIISGGHSIHDKSIKYGLSVTGIVHPDKILRNNNCQENDVLILTKPLGVSIINSAYMIGECSKESFDICINQMTTLNKYSSEIIKNYKVNSCTDVTGFGLLGHLVEMLSNKYSAEIYSDNIPILPETYECAKNFIITSGGQLNRNYLESKVKFEINDFPLEEILFDPQTSGGLLVSVPEIYSIELLNELNKLNIKSSIIGKVIKREKVDIIVK